MIKKSECVGSSVGWRAVGVRLFYIVQIMVKEKIQKTIVKFFFLHH